VLIASDRIVFNARKQEIIGFSKEGIGFSSEKGISLDGKQVVEIESEQKISLGINAIEPVLLGKRTMNWLNDLCTILMNITNAITQQTHPTGTGPSGIPINVGDFSAALSDLGQLKGQIRKLPSQLAFVNEKSGGPSESEIAESEQLLKPSQFGREGDAPDTLVDILDENEQLENDAIAIVDELSRIEQEKARLLDDVLGEKDPAFDYGDAGLVGDGGTNDTNGPF
jgi:hypothetical protein